MPVPATTGQLRTKVSEMEIGDYIKVEHNIVSAGTIASNVFGINPNSTLSEIPLAGMSIGNGYYYMVKTAKGLLVADRVTQHSITWDRLNTDKVVQSLTWDEKIIPAMTANDLPSGLASASSEYDATYAAWKAFNNVISTTTTAEGWSALSGTAGWLAYEFPIEKVIKKYTVTAFGNNTGSAPKDWTFEGWDGSNWIALDTQKGVVGYVAGAAKEFLMVNDTAYKKYRINVTAINGAATLGISELKMFETTGIVRSLTGGVAYADASGNKATVDSGNGAWPINNEWDKLIVNFPTDKITAGKTLDDVFHWSSSCTLCQDTPINGISNHEGAVTSNVYRTWRGFLSQGRFSSAPSGNAYSTLSFRPVFQYKEGV